jgi:biopolymer transport protein ExbD
MKRRAALPGVNLTPMIDVVFQMIIFFICTIELEKNVFDETVHLEWARDAQAVGEQNPLTVHVNLRQDGSLSIGGALIPNLTTFRGLLRNTVNRYGASNVPVVIRGDKATSHHHVRAVMDVCKSVGIWRLSFAALKEEG